MNWYILAGAGRRVKGVVYCGLVTAETKNTLSARAGAVVSYTGVALAALIPRVADLGGFVTVDEANFWITRSHTFLNALRTGDFAATAISTHPGVTTMWLGAAGILLQRFLVDTGLLSSVTFATALAFLRLPAALAHTICILAGFALLRRMLPPPAALLAALLWAADPFVIAYSRVLHVDALAASFGATGLLAALRAWQLPRRRGMLALSGICTGLAVLSKSPALALAPVVGLLALWHAWRPPDMPESHGTAVRTLGGALRAAAPAFAGWLGIVIVTVIVCWPALWANPVAAFNQIRVGVEVEGAQPHMLGNYFLGRPDPAPGALFYLVALALRSTPLTLSGLLLLPFVWRRLDTSQRRMLAGLACFVLAFTAAMTLFPKKFDRYLTPVFPMVDILAAAGLCGTLNGALGMVRQRRSFLAPFMVRNLVALLIGALALANVWFWHPYAIAAANQWLGGTTVAARTFAVGWGEGHEQVAAWLNQRPDIRGVATVARLPVTLQPYMQRGATTLTPRGDELQPDTGYVVVYISQQQDGIVPPPFDAFYGRVPPLFTAYIHGVAYAWVYQAPPKVEHLSGARFGDALMLHGYDRAAEPERGRTLALLLTLFINDTPPPGVRFFAHLVGPDGQRVTQADLPLPVDTWTPGSYVRQELPLALPGDLLPGHYRLFTGIYDPVSGARLPPGGVVPADPALAGPDAVELFAFDLP